MANCTNPQPAPLQPPNIKVEFEKKFCKKNRRIKMEEEKKLFMN
jgi:hypothetical protein